MSDVRTTVPGPVWDGQTLKWLFATAVGIVIWFALYNQLLPFSQWVVSLLPVDPHSHLGEAIAFFVYDTPKVLMLLSLVVFAMGIVRSFFSPEKTRAILAGRAEGIGNVAAAGLGVLTPFCSCSAVSLFIGFVSAGVPLGVTFSFLIAAPMVNEIALGLLFAAALEDFYWPGVVLAAPEILYAGVVSGGIAFTIQAVAQRYTTSAQAAIFLSSEAVFASLFGIILLGESLPAIGYAGCALMLVAMLMVEVVPALRPRKTA